MIRTVVKIDPSKRVTSLPSIPRWRRAGERQRAQAHSLAWLTPPFNSPSVIFSLGQSLDISNPGPSVDLVHGGIMPSKKHQVGWWVGEDLDTNPRWIFQEVWGKRNGECNICYAPSTALSRLIRMRILWGRTFIPGENEMHKGNGTYLKSLG